MVLVLVGSLPVSGVNVGLAAAVPALLAEVTNLQAQIEGLAPALEGQVKLATAGLPPLPLLTSALAAQFNPVNVALSFGSIGVTGKAENLDLVAKIGILEGQIQLVENVVLTLETGTAATGIAGWNYAGRAAGFGRTLDLATRAGFGSFEPEQNVQGIVVLTESTASWQAFSKGFNTGASATVPVDPEAERLIFMGELAGGAWDIGVSQQLGTINLFLAEIEGNKLGLEAAAEVSLGVGLPEPDTQIAVGEEIVATLGLDGILDALGASVDLDAAIGSIQAKIDGKVGIVTDVQGQLSAGGLSVWTYAGPAGAFGEDVLEATAGGLPGGSGAGARAYGVAVVGTPVAMASFGSVFGP